MDRVYIEITNVCNLNCSFCKDTARLPSFMNKTLFARTLSQVRPLAKDVVFHILGEPLLHPELEDFIDLTIAAGRGLIITTNGTLLKGNLAVMLASKKLKQLNISLQVLNAIPDQADNLEEILDFVTMAQQQNPDGYINLRLWNMLAEDNALLMQILNDYYRTAISLPEHISDFKNRKSYPLKDKVYLHVDSRFIWPNLDLPIRQVKGFCYGLSSHCGVLADGTVVPCCLDGDGIIALGNISEQELSSILSSARARRMKTGFQKRLLSEELCKRCEYIGRFKQK